MQADLNLLPTIRGRRMAVITPLDHDTPELGGHLEGVLKDLWGRVIAVDHDRNPLLPTAAL